MHTLAMIDMEPRTADAIVPAKMKQRSDSEQFGKVLREKEQPRQPQAASKSVAKQPEPHKATADKQVVAVDQKNAPKQVVQEQTPAAENLDCQPDSQLQATLAQPLVDCLKTMIPEEAIASEEVTAEIEMVLIDLIQQLDPEQLQSLTLDVDGDEVAEQLLQQVDALLTDDPKLVEKVELLAAMLAELPQQNGAPLDAEKLLSPRQLLQQVLAVVVPEPKAVVTDQVKTEAAARLNQTAEELLVAAATVEEIDPRFAGLLKPRTEQQQPQTTAPTSKPVQLHGNVQSATPELAEEMVESTPTLEINQPATTNVKQMVESLMQQAPGNLQQGPVQGAEVNRAMPQTQIVQLPSGQQVTEGQIFDQVVTQLSGSVNGESGRMVLRLQPAELGSLKLELTIEGDRVRANLHAQTQQVREVLERNLPQLRSALAEQGLKIDQFQVSIDENHDQQSQFDNLAQQQQDGSQQRSDRQPVNVEAEELNIPLAHLIQNGGGGISLHV